MTQRKLLALALAAGLLTAFFVYAYVRAAVERPQVGNVAVVVAATEIRPKTTLTASMLTMKEVPATAVHPDAVRNIDELVGRLTKDNLLAGEQVLYGRLYGPDERPGLTFVIPPGKRAVSVAVNEVIGVAGFIKPGDRVDIIGTFDTDSGSVTTTVLQNVEVLAIAQKMEDDDVKAKVATTVTLALSLEEAEKVTLGEEKGSLRLALRPAEQQGKEYVSDMTTSKITAGKGQTLQKISPSIRTTSSSSSSSSASGSAAESAETPAAAAPSANSGSSLSSSARDGGWAVEVYRGVQKEVVEVAETE